MHADGKSTLASVSKWNSGKINWFALLEHFPLRESTSIMSGIGKGSHLMNYLEVHSLSSDQVFVSTPFQRLVDGL